jgi:hypothetical protein
MQPLGWLLLAILVAYLCAAIAPWLHRRKREGAGRLPGWALVAIVSVCPLIIPSTHKGLRALSAVISCDLAFKMVESFRHWQGESQCLGPRDYYPFLIPFPIFAAVFPDHRRRIMRSRSPWPEVSRVVLGIVASVIAVAATLALSSLPLVRSRFMLHHFLMLPAFVLAVESLSQTLCGLERLAGYDTRPIVRNLFLSPNVAEFWRRYNNRVHDWLYWNVFMASGGRRSPVRSMLLVFLISGAFHELAFTIATSRLTGYQFAFFSSQGLAIVASKCLGRRAQRAGSLGRLTARLATWIFLAVTSVLFFDGVSRIFPFIYTSRSPLP